MKVPPLRSAVAVIFSLLFLLSACGGDDRFDIDVSDVEVDTEIQRLDKDLFDPELDSMELVHQKLQEKYGSFYKIYIEQILREGSLHDPMLPVNLELFITDIAMAEVYGRIEEKFEDLEEEEAQFEMAFTRYKYFFPDSVVPEVIAYHSGFNYKVFPTDSALVGVGLEWFLGTEDPVIQRLSPERFPEYVKDKMERKYLVSDAIKGWLQVKLQEQVRNADDLVGHMIFYGKILYLMDALMPETPDSIKIDYSSEEMAWCKEQEGRIWKEFVDKELLFKTDMNLIRKYTMDAPFTTGMPKESPGKVGRWMGWRIVRSFMEQHPEMTLKELCQHKNPKGILKFYKPEK